jgi:hypothetical protein
MAANIFLENSFAAWGEAGGVGQKAANGPFYVATLGTDDVEVESASMTVAAQDVVRDGYPRETAGELPPILGGRAWDWQCVTPARYDNAGTAMEVRDLLLACGLTRTNDTYSPASPLAQHQSAGIALTEGTILKHGIGAAGNLVWSGKAGDITRFAFSGKAIHFEPEESAMAGSTYAVDTIAAPVWDRGLFQLGAGSNAASAPEAAVDNVLSVSEFSFDLGNTVSPRTKGQLIHVPVYYAASHDAGATDVSVGTISAGSFVDETTDANDTDVGDVSPFPAATPAVGDGFYVGMPHRFNGLRISIGTAGSTSMTVLTEYWNATTATWTTLPTSVAQVTDFDDGTGIKYVTWEQPAGWSKATINGTAAYFVRFRVSAFTSTATTALVTQIWAMVPASCARYCVTAQKPRLTVVVEQEAASTFNPFEDWRNRSTRTVTHQVGTRDNNTLILTMTAASLMVEPEVVHEDGLVRYRLVYGAPTSWSLAAT